MFSPAPKGSSSRLKASPFTPSFKGTPNKRASSIFSPRRVKDRRLQAGNRSLQLSQILDDTSHHKVESFGLPLPVLITEALTLTDRSTQVTVNIDPSGWAWLVGGRKLFVWRYKTTGRGFQCKELTLPPSDLAHSAARVCVLAGKSDSNPTACIAVSPEGVVRYWPNIAYEASTAEISAELKGEECASVVNFQPFGCLLATTTSSLLLLMPSFGQNAITCSALKTSQGMFSGIGRRMSSFIFGASPAQTSGAPLQAIVAGEYDEEDGARPFYVLSDAHLQKWRMSLQYPEKILYQADIVRLFRDALARKVWDQDSVQLPQLNVWLLDMQLVNDGVMVLGAGVNLEASLVLYYALATLQTAGDQQPVQLEKLIMLGHTEKYEEQREEELLKYGLLVPSTFSSEAFVYGSRVIFMVSINDSQLSDRMDLQSPSDQLIGAGTCDGHALFFSNNYGMLCITPQQAVETSILEEIGQDSLLRSGTSFMGFSKSQALELSQCEDKLSRLKACFITSLSGNQGEVEKLLGDLLPPAVMELSVSETGREIDKLVAALSCDIIDDYPTADPRWAESIRQEGGTTNSLIIAQQLRDKVKAHDYFRAFLKKYGLWSQLSVTPVRDGLMSTCLLLCEHVEKLEAAINLREQRPEYTKIVDVCIRQVLKQREGPHPSGLTPQDIFYREVSKVQDIAVALLQHEMDALASGLTARQSSQLVVSINSILQGMVTAALVYRQSHAEVYQGPEDENRIMPEYVPWTSTSGSNGLRTILSKQVSVTVERAIPETQDVETRGTLFQQLLDLADLLLDGYSMEHEQYDRAASLAEKYFDFDVLISVCEATENQDRLQRYITQFADRGFSQHLFNWYLKEGKRSQLLSHQFAHNPELKSFLAAENTRYLSWLHEINTGDFLAAHETLVDLARSEKVFLAKKKTLLSLSKLAALASDQQETLETNIEAINEELNLVQLQETLPSEALESISMDPKNMRVMTPSELIRMYAGDLNIFATEVDFKKALDLLQYVDKNDSAEDFDELKLFIWCQAILRDKDRWTDDTETDPVKLRDDTVFFKTVDLAYTEGDDLTQLLPPVEQILEQRSWATYDMTHISSSC
ncbi:hypothetical protein C0Q70_07778 [Pomacea canaliculata]|uniref:Nucleoporin Nup133/Nup155-like C-terminal domain-containing protein n=1 Tax=Pomacea canaliculata TaxID=400727 RepID=A0A2T7PFZ6_POMCA|nr:hypothetical protein C0Q70_07778 [Pomacea canaliculata]